MPEFKPVKYVLFDVDGLLLDTEKICADTFTDVLKIYGVTYTNEMRIKVMGTGPRNTCTRFIEDYKLPVSLEKLTEQIATKLYAAMEAAELMPGAERLVTHLKKHDVPIAVATGSDMGEFKKKTKRHENLFCQFHHIVTGGSDPEVKNGKPAPEIFIVCASRFPEKPSPSECLVFEDAPTGVQAGISAGMQVVMVPDAVVPEEKKKLATKVISSLTEFKPEEFGLPKFD